MYYLLIAISSAMFGTQFLCNKRFQKNEGASIEKIIMFAMSTSLVIALAMLLANGFRVEFSWFSFMTAGISSIAGILFTYCSVMSISKVNLSMYSLFAMLGGMLLPFISGILFWDEPLTFVKGISLLIIAVALFIGVDFKLDKITLIYCFSVFILNGLICIMAKLHQTRPDINISSQGYMLLRSIIISVICLIIICFLNKDKLRLNNVKDSLLNITGFGLMSGIGNLLVLIALVHVAASVQYPMITGGTIIVTTAICFFTKEKITYKNILSATLALIGTLLLL